LWTKVATLWTLANFFHTFFGHSASELCHKIKKMATNTGKNLKNWLDIIRVEKRDLSNAVGMSKSKLYKLFTLNTVNWMDIIDIHNYLKRKYDYNIKDFFPEFPEDTSEVRESVEYYGNDDALLHKIQQDRDIWRDKYTTLLERHTQLQDRLINDLQDLFTNFVPSQNKMMSIIADAFRK
jgi:hypothetical protein